MLTGTASPLSRGLTCCGTAPATQLPAEVPSSSPSWPRARAGMRPGHMIMDGLSPACGDAAAPSIGAVFAFRWIDKVGRRPLALWGYAGMAVFILVAAAGVGFLTGVPKTVLVMAGFSFFMTAFAIGVGGTGWLIQGEAFPTAVSQSRGRCGRHQTRGAVRRRLRHP
jgi:hypothetical protein